jgi:hypothetical protein
MRVQRIETQPATERDTGEHLIEGEAQSVQATHTSDSSNSISQESGIQSAEIEGPRPGPAVREEEEQRSTRTSHNEEEKETGSWSVDYLVGPGVPRMDRQLYEDEYERAADEIDTQIAGGLRLSLALDVSHTPTEHVASPLALPDLQQEYKETTDSLILWLRRGREVQAERHTCRLYSALNAVQAEEGQLGRRMVPC